MSNAGGAFCEDIGEESEGFSTLVRVLSDTVTLSSGKWKSYAARSKFEALY